jgi:hypothetical protein
LANGDITHRIVVSGTRSNGDAILSFDKSHIDSSVADVSDRSAINIGTTVQTIITVGTVAGATLAAIQRLVVKNEDASNFVIVGLIVSGSRAVYLKVRPGEAMSIDPSVCDDGDGAGGAFVSFGTVTSVTLKADTAACVCRVNCY